MKASLTISLVGLQRYQWSLRDIPQRGRGGGVRVLVEQARTLKTREACKKAAEKWTNAHGFEIVRETESIFH